MTRTCLLVAAVMAVNPIQYLVIPRFIALFIMCPILTVIAFFVGMAGSYVISVYVEGVNKGAFLEGLWTYLQMYDVGGAIFKCDGPGWMGSVVIAHGRRG